MVSIISASAAAPATTKQQHADPTSSSPTVALTLLVDGGVSLDNVAKSTEEKVAAAITKPILDKLAGYENDTCWSDAADKKGKAGRTYSAGQVGPTERIRNVAEALMELPMLLESLGLVDSAEVDTWLAVAVKHFTDQFASSIKQVPLTTKRSAEQAKVDLEYTLNVLTAISDDAQSHEALQAIAMAVEAVDDLDALIAAAPPMLGSTPDAPAVAATSVLIGTLM